jgi:hypothetical protein
VALSVPRSPSQPSRAPLGVRVVESSSAVVSPSHPGGGLVSRSCARSSVDRAPDFESGCRRFESSRARAHGCGLSRSPRGIVPCSTLTSAWVMVGHGGPQCPPACGSKLDAGAEATRFVMAQMSDDHLNARRYRARGWLSGSATFIADRRTALWRPPAWRIKPTMLGSANALAPPFAQIDCSRRSVATGDTGGCSEAR